MPPCKWGGVGNPTSSHPAITQPLLNICNRLFGHHLGATLRSSHGGTTPLRVYCCLPSR